MHIQMEKPTFLKRPKFPELSRNKNSQVYRGLKRTGPLKIKIYFAISSLDVAWPGVLPEKSLIISIHTKWSANTSLLEM